MKKRFNLNVVLGLTLVTFVIIGVLVWPAPKEARAELVYQVFLWEGNRNNPVTDATVLFHFDNEDPIEANHIGGGMYIVDHDQSANWQIELDEWGPEPVYIGLEPWWGWFSDELLGSENDQEWEVEGARRR